MFCVGCPLVNAMQCVGLVSSRRTNEVRKVVPASQYRFEKLTATWDTAGKTFWVVVALTTSTQQALVASMHFHLNEGDQDDQDEGDSLDEIWNLNDPLLSRLVAPRVTPPPQQEVVPARARPAFVFLPEKAAARPASSAWASLSVGPRKSLVSCGIALILVLSLRPRLPLLGESPIAVVAHGTTAGDP